MQLLKLCKSRFRLNFNVVPHANKYNLKLSLNQRECFILLGTEHVAYEVFSAY